MLTKGLFTSNTDIWSTPQDLYDKLNSKYHFTCDVCALPENAKCDNYYTPEQDGLKQTWGGGIAFAIRLMVETLANGLKKPINPIHL